MEQRPTRDPDALYAIRAAVAKGLYIEKLHATERLNERHVDRLEVRHVLLNGRRDKTRDEYRAEYGTWTYAIEGSTPDRDKRLRIIVVLRSDSARGDVAKIVSVIDITKRGRNENR